MVQLYALRGISKEKLKKPSSSAGTQKDLPAYRCETVEEMLNFYLSCTTSLSLNDVTATCNGLAVGEPYPKIFDEFVGPNGGVLGSPRSPTIGGCNYYVVLHYPIPSNSFSDVQSVPVLSGLHSSSGVGEMLETLLLQSKRINISRIPSFVDLGVDKDVFSETLNNLNDLKECYEDNYYL